MLYAIRIDRMIGDKLASGAPSATFTGPRLNFDQATMQRDLRELPEQAFLDKYMITSREYTLMISSDGEETNSLIRQVQQHAEAIERLVEQEKKEDQDLRRQCFIEPFIAHDMAGRILVSRDQPVLRKETSKLALPRHLRQQRESLPTTGHIIRATVVNSQGEDVGHKLIGLRVIFGPMSGTAICFKNYPTWILLDIHEVLGLVMKEDAEIVEQELEPLT
jgi:hypothetical protein